VKEVLVGTRRYIVCLNPERRREDARSRQAIVDSLKKSLRRGSTALVGNKGYRRFLSSTKAKGFRLDPNKIRRDARFDGKWVLRTNTDLPPSEVALTYHHLWTIEALFRTMKSTLSTRPIFHRLDETIRGHVFCSFLAIKLMFELKRRLATKGIDHDLAATLRDLDDLEEVTIEHQDRRFLLRTELRGHTGTVMQLAGVAIPPAVRACPAEDP
jgi:transposase